MTGMKRKRRRRNTKIINENSIRKDLDGLRKRMMMMFAVLSRQVPSDRIVLIERIVLEFNYQNIESHLTDVVMCSRPSKRIKSDAQDHVRCLLRDLRMSSVSLCISPSLFVAMTV